MKIILNRKYSWSGKAYIEATLDGRPIRWGACLSYAVTGVKSKLQKEGICVISEQPLSCTARKGPFSKEFTIPPLHFGQSVKEFDEAFRQRIAIFKEMKKWLEVPLCNDSITIEI